MNNGYTIYFGDRPYYIDDALSPELYKQTTIAGTIIANHPDKGMISKTIRDMELEGTKAVIILTDEVEHYWSVFQKHFHPVTAGGGLVMNEKEEILFIFRRGKWDLPKGKLDEGETIEECALREIMEETGIEQVNLDSFACNTYHIYQEKRKQILKTTVWFYMKAPGNQKTYPANRGGY